MFANVLGVLLVATAASALDALPAARESFDVASASAIATAKNEHEATKMYVDELLSQIQLHKSHESGLSSDGETPVHIRAPSVECHEFLKQRINTSRSLVLECSQGHLKLITSQRDRIEKFFRHVLSRLDRQKTLVDNCVSWFDGFPDGPSRSASCIEVMKRDMEAMMRNINGIFFGIAAAAEKIANTWISDVGLCVSIKELPNRTIDWFNACKNKI